MNNLINPQMLKAFMQGNPQQIAMQLLQKNMGNNPILQNVMNCANNGQYGQIEQIARNLCASKGIDADKMFKEISQQIK